MIKDNGLDTQHRVSPSQKIQATKPGAASVMEKGEIISNQSLHDGYFMIKFYEPEICQKAHAGQFVHVLISGMNENILRRPFSICDVDSQSGELTVVYKIVGKGTKHMATLPPGAKCNLMGPLGHGFTPPEADCVPILVDGGYGVAATQLLAKNAETKGVLLLGARTKSDIILTEYYEKARFDLRIATNDGSRGTRGFVTELLPAIFEEYQGRKIKFYACGPTPMLMALGKILKEKGYFDSELSLDHLMCCGVGACFACVVRVNADNEDGWRYARSCNEGPVFRVDEVYFG